MNVVCFHGEDEENGYLSNWYSSPFTLNGVSFSSMEQYMMYRKALCFGDEKIAAQILAENDVAKIKALGRDVSGYVESLWNGVRQIVIYEGLLAKFSQNPELKKKLKKMRIYPAIELYTMQGILVVHLLRRFPYGGTAHITTLTD